MIKLNGRTLHLPHMAETFNFDVQGQEYLLTRQQAQEIYNKLDVLLAGVTPLQRAEYNGATLYSKYRIMKNDGSPIDPAARYFVLRIDTDRAARMALFAYASAIEKDNAEFANELRGYAFHFTNKADIDAKTESRLAELREGIE